MKINITLALLGAAFLIFKAADGQAASSVDLSSGHFQSYTFSTADGTLGDCCAQTTRGLVTKSTTQQAIFRALEGQKIDWVSIEAKGTYEIEPGARNARVSAKLTAKNTSRVKGEGFKLKADNFAAKTGSDTFQLETSREISPRDTLNLSALGVLTALVTRNDPRICFTEFVFRAHYTGDKPTDGGQPPNPVPVPPAVWLFGSALAGLGIIRRKGERDE